MHHIVITFKTPDAVFYALQGLSEEDKETAKEFIDQYVKNDEYVSLDFNLIDKTVKVIKQK